MKKKILSLILTAALALSMTACDPSDDIKDDNKKDDKNTSAPKSTTDPKATDAPETTAPKEPTKPANDDTNGDADYSQIVTNHGQLSVDGADLVDKDGKPYQLRGMSTHGIQWFPQFVNESAFKELRDDWKVNAIRLAMYSGESEGYKEDTREEIEQYVEDGIEICIALDIYCIVDWHILNDETPLKMKDEAIAFFDKFSKKYADCPNVIYEICNEPNGSATWEDDIQPYAEEVIPVIRANAPNAVIIVGTAQWSQKIEEPLDDPEPLAFDNLMYALHFYASTHKDWLRDSLKKCRNGGLPVMVTEFGMCDASGDGNNNFREAETWLNLLDEYNISYFNWCLADKDETCCALEPESNPEGGWSEADYSESGSWIRDWFKSKA